MKDELFNELVESVKEAGAILRGETEPERAWSVDDPDVAAIRAAYGISQAKFATLLGISVRTIQNWEQGQRKPRGPARVLLEFAAENPKALLRRVQRAEPSKRLVG